MKRYIVFTVSAEPMNPEILSSILWELPISGINEAVNCIEVFAEENSGINIENISSLLNKLIEEKLLRSFNIEENIVENKNWNEEWEKSLNIIEVSDRIIIKPSIKEYKEKPGQIIINIDPKMSFGTGEHQTTKLTLKLLEKYLKKDDKILDVGTGTGVLAIAAIKLGAKNALAIDNDEWSFLNSKENIHLNYVEEKIEIKLSEISKINEKDFDLILANIQKNVLLDIAEELIQKTDKNGKIILSGLLDIDEDDIVKKYESLGLKLSDEAQMDDWIALVFEKNQNQKK